MNILHVTHNYHPVVGGAELMMKHISEGLARRGHRVTVLTSNAPSAEAYLNSRIKPLPPGVEVINGVVVKRLPILQLPFPIQMLLGGVMMAFWRGNLPGNDLVRILWNGPYMKGLHRQISETEADLVVAIPLPFMHIYRASSAARKKGVPLVVIPCCHPLDAFAFENPRHYRLLRSSQAVIANTSYEQAYLTSMGVPEEKIHVAGEGVNPENFDEAEPGSFRRKYGLDDHEKVLLFVGRKAEGKGLGALLGAMQRVWQSDPEVKLVIAGSSTEFFRRVIEPRIAQLPEKLRPCVINIDDFKESDKPSFYRDCDIFVLPSKIESFGIVFLEAWICGKPVIGCRTGPVASVVSEGRDGLLVPYGDAEELSKAITRLLADEGLRRKLGHNGREKVLRQYTWDRIVSKVESIYQAVVQERGVYGGPTPHGEAKLDLSELSAESVRRGLQTDLIGRSIVYYSSLDSTNDLLKELAAQGAPEGTLVIADRQTAGRGRLGRKWLAPPGTSLLLSLLFRPDLAPNQAQRLTMICSLAIADAIEGLTGLPVGLKWPNDIFVCGKKAGGILTESGTTGGRLCYVVVGMGLNINLDISTLAELKDMATSLSLELGREVSRLELLWKILEGIETRYKSLRIGESPHKEWAARLINLDRQVQVTTSDGVLVGWAEGVDTDGALILHTPDGQRKRVLAGDVTLRAPHRAEARR